MTDIPGAKAATSLSKEPRKGNKNNNKTEAASKYSFGDTLKQQYRFVPAKLKDCYLLYILIEKSRSTSMVFTLIRTCEATRLLALMLGNIGLRVIPISGQITQKLIGKKLPEFEAQEEEVLLLLERVTEAKRLSRMKIKETGGHKRRRMRLTSFMGRTRTSQTSQNVGRSV
ncbi:hypothetical protein L2E82_02256 [Cichorium intybus]|uniref:Uncharacterized protein n=1 Tax=Cichorium intybus TaxID=13427 RepID=A0ACB9H289_CICIN|nr:hypothetical protein L2E82_02256 [Cichorium intybus]